MCLARRSAGVNHLYALRFAMADRQEGVTHASEEGSALLLKAVFIFFRTASFVPVVAAPGALMTIVIGFTMAALGLGLTQSWWLLGLAMAATFIVAVERGQYRTTRPKSAVLSA